MIKGRSNIVGRSCSRWVMIPPSLVAIDLWQWKYNGFSLSRDLVVMTLPAPCLVSLNRGNSPKKCLLAKFGSHRSYGNGDINSYISSHMSTLEKDEFTASIRHIERFLKSGIPIYNSKVPDAAGRKTIKRWRRRRTAQAKRYAFYANARSFKPIALIYRIFVSKNKNPTLNKYMYYLHISSSILDWCEFKKNFTWSILLLFQLLFQLYHQ